jgi:hypothetical protein
MKNVDAAVGASMSAIAVRDRSKTTGKVAIGLCGVAALTLITAIFAYPAGAAAACPTCYGFDELEPGLYLERGASDVKASHIKAIVAEARLRVSAFYGSPIVDPSILICATDECYHRLGGGDSRGRTLVDQAIFLAPAGINATIASHELSHVQIHSRIGKLPTLLGSVPEWFVEGVAVVVSDDPRYLAPAGSSDRCLVAPDGPLPWTLRDWLINARSQQLYAKAGCAVSRWMSARGGPQAVIELLRKVGGGYSFEAAYRA